MSIYEEWGFFDSPFSHMPLTGNDVGVNLLVGREKEKEKIALRLKSTDKICTIEGDVGVGKTSLVNVATYEYFSNNSFYDGSPILIPCIESFQLSKNSNLETFRKGVLQKLALTIVKNTNVVNKKMSKIIENFFNPERVSSINGGLSILGCGIDGGKTKDLNTTHIFEEDGFYAYVIDTLVESFSSDRNSGIVCIIDNLELVGSNIVAKNLLEELRDTVFNIPGTRWVLCGANHIFKSIVSSPRLEGYIHDSIIVKPLNEKVIPEVLNKRRNNFSKDFNTYLPFNELEFVSLYRILNGNTRTIFDKIDKYCLWVYEQGENPKDDYEKERIFEKWLDTVTIDYLHSVLSTVTYESFVNLFSVSKSKRKFNKSYYEASFDSLALSFEEFISDMDKTYLMKLDEDGFAIFETKGLFLKYFFETYRNMSELRNELKNKYRVDLTDYE